MVVKKVINNVDSINHVALRFDIESGSIVGKYLAFKGKTSSSPDNWTISIDDDENDYHYDNKGDYEQDIKILIS